MADTKKSFPMLPINHWWGLRKKFKQSIPGVVTDTYLATVLDMKVDSARANVLPFLRQLGIIDEEGKTGDRAKLWRDDEQYSKVCNEILREVYPQELLEAVPTPNEDRTRAERWFANHTGSGEAAAGRMASLYAVLAQADASKAPEDRPKKPGQEQASMKREKRVETPETKNKPDRLADSSRGAQVPLNQPQIPGININLQIHISADSTPDQIDQIFASMAKHIYHRG
jgi:hypothetical protein